MPDCSGSSMLRSRTSFPVTDRLIATVLAELGFVEAPERAAALGVLQRGGLTRPGKRAITTTKLPQIRELLDTTFALSCTACAPTVRMARPRAQLLVVTDERCENCEGSDNRAAALRFSAACRGSVRHVVVVGGSPGTRQALRHQLGGIQLRLIDGTRSLSATRARQLLHWADLVLVWGPTQLDHGVSTLFTSAKSRKVVSAARRGVGGLLDAGTNHLSRMKIGGRTAA